MKPFTVLSLPIELLFMKIELSSPRFPTIYHNFIVPKYYSLLSYSLRMYFFYSNLSTRPYHSVYHTRPPPIFLILFRSYLILVRPFVSNALAKIDARYFCHVPSTGYVCAIKIYISEYKILNFR